jgi:flagellar hook-associated protein 3 FlgL
MRITQNYTNRSYLRNNNKVLSNYNNSMEKIWSNMDYFRASDNPINASKAMTVRKNLRDLDIYDDNLETADGIFKAAETDLYTISNNIYLNVQDKMEQICNGTYNQDEMDIIANELKEYADSAVETLNSDYAERNLFGGTNNSSPAFATEVDDDGKTWVTYNGVRLDDMVDDGTGNPENVPGSKPIYIDIGIGIKYDENGEIDPQTALDVGLNGAKITGFGTDEDDDGKVYSNNFVQLIYDAAAALTKGDVETVNATLDRLSAANTGILTEITTLGAKQNSIEFYQNKNDDYRISLQSRQNDVEYCDTEKEIINMDSAYAAYQASLQLSSNILPRSIFDFI